MKKYIFIFTVAYLLSLIVFLIISEIIDSSGSANVVTLISGAVVASMVFVKDQGRAPSKAERRLLAWGSYFGALIVSGAFVCGFLLLSQDGSAIVTELSQIQIWIWVIASVVITLSSIAILSLCYGWVAQKLAVQKTTK